VSAGKTKYTRTETYIDPDGEKFTVTMTATMPAEWSDGAQEAVRIDVDHAVTSLEDIVSGMRSRRPGLFPGPTSLRGPAEPAEG
jgi:hypothetical protein